MDTDARRERLLSIKDKLEVWSNEFQHEINGIKSTRTEWWNMIRISELEEAVKLMQRDIDHINRELKEMEGEEQ